ncbi:MAG: lipid A biosynthesis acyltransferase [Bacteroidetes bacterium]|nr:lipid A biosynthesis acyltransferase [Bacteroidota bacterium]MBS1610866.1 lipid A biosynthesis acyltransferase [Bacteroidota bacterium]
MPQWQGKSKGPRLGYSIFIAILRKWGVKPAYFLLYFVTFWYYLFSFRSNGIMYRFFTKKIGFGSFQSIRWIYRNYYLFGQTIIDRIVVMSGMPNRFTFNFDGEGHLHEMVSLKKGGLLLSAHIGNWEIAGHLLKRLNTRINIVMFDGEHQQLKQYLTSITGERNANIIVIKNDLSHIYQIKEAFDKNELVCMHADRFVEGVKTAEADFLNEKARFPIGPFVLADKFKVPVSFVFALKESKLHYHFFATQGKVYEGEDRIMVQQKMLGDFTTEMEDKVKLHPEQWYNYYEFWR